MNLDVLYQLTASVRDGDLTEAELVHEVQYEDRCETFTVILRKWDSADDDQMRRILGVDTEGD